MKDYGKSVVGGFDWRNDFLSMNAGKPFLTVSFNNLKVRTMNFILLESEG